MPANTPVNIVASIVTSNYIHHALVLYGYMKESNPEVPYLVLIIGERNSIIKRLPQGPKWLFWDELVEEEDRKRLAAEYLPFELSCVMRGRLHRYLASQNDFGKWILIDTDVGILDSLEPIFDALDLGPICLTPHATKPISLDRIVPHESNLLELGLYNGGVVGMRQSEEASSASQWLTERLEKYGHSHRHRQHQGLKSEIFEFVDQIWLNLIPIYYPSTVILRDERLNLGHWNLFQGSLTIHHGKAFFDNRKVVVIHFSGLPDDRLEHVAAHESIYREIPSHSWAVLAADYQARCIAAEREFNFHSYCYENLQPTANKNAVSQQPYQLRATDETCQASTALRIQCPSYYRRNPIKPSLLLSLPRAFLNRLIYLKWRTKKFFLSDIPSLRKPWLIEQYLFMDQSRDSFLEPSNCTGNYQLFIVRMNILEAVKRALPYFHGRFLDLGSGSSPYERMIMATGKVSQYIKMDFSESDYHRGNKLDLVWDGMTIPLENNSIDTVMMTEVLEHIYKPGDLLTEVRRILKPSGIIFLTVPFIWPMQELPHDFHRFTPIALETYLKEADFEVVKIEMLGGWDLSLAQFLGLWLTNRSMGRWKRVAALLLAWPFYNLLIKSGKNEYMTIKNHQMFSGLAALASAPPSN